jgi:hypothetical protein
MPVWVSVYRVLRAWSFAHVIDKSPEIIPPSFTDDNSRSSPVFITAIVRIITATEEAFPNGIGGMLYVANLFSTMLCRCLSP